MTTPSKQQGFSSMPLEKRRRIARMGGKAAHRYGRAHLWDSEEAKAASLKGLKARRSKALKRFKEEI